MWYRLAKYIMCLVTLELIWKFLHSIEKYNCYQYLFTLEVIKSHTLKEKKTKRTNNLGLLCPSHDKIGIKERCG